MRVPRYKLTLCLLAISVLQVILRAAPVDPLPFGQEELPIPPALRINVTTPRTVSLLGQAITRETAGQARAMLVRDLGVCAKPEAANYINDAMGDADPIVRAEAARAAATVVDSSLLKSLRRLMADSSPLVRREAGRAGAAFGDPEIVSAAVRDTDAAVRAAAFASPAGNPESVGNGLQELDSSAQVLAIDGLARPNASGQAATVAKFLGSSVALKCAAIRALAGMQASTYGPAVVKALDDPHPTVRRCAVEALIGLLSGPQRQDLALRMLGDGDATVRQAAASMLEKLPDARAVPLLIKQLDDEYTPLHDAAREALVAARAEAAAGQLLDHRDPRRREDGSLVLGRLKSDAAIERHIALLQDADWKVASQAAQSLGLIGNPKAAPAVGVLVARIDKLIEQVPEDQLAGAFAVGGEALVASARLGHQPALAVCKTLIDEKRRYPPDVRAAAAYAFGLLGNASDVDTCRRLLGVYRDPEEAPQVKLEAIKALGHVGFAEAAPQLQEIGRSDPDPALRWVAHWAGDRVTGDPTSFEPPKVPWTAEVSLVDLTGGTDPSSLTAVLQFGPEFVAGSWTPLRIGFNNSGDQPVSGSALLPIHTEAGGVQISVPSLVPPHSRATKTAYAYFPEPASAEQRDRPMLIAEWLGTAGARIARTELVGRSVASFRTSDGPAGAGEDGIILSISDGDTDISEFAQSLGTVAGCIFRPQTIHPEQAPQHPAGYDACQFVLLDVTDPDSLDLCQRQALVDHVVGGGVLILCAPPMSNRDIRHSWLAPYLPVQLIGRRYARRLEVTGIDHPTDLAGLTPVAEAIDRAEAGWRIVLRDGQFVHGAFKALGLGRVVFTSFPPGALHTDEQTATAIWDDLAALSKPRTTRWDSSDLAAQQDELLRSMVGLTAPSWSLAAGVAGGYAVLVLLAHLMLNRERGPSAFAAGAGMAILASAALLGVGSLRQSRQPLTGARLTTFDLAPGGGGLQQEAHGYFGADDPGFGLRVSSPDATLRPAISNSSDPPRLEVPAFAAPQAGIRAIDVSRVWSVSRSVGTDQRVDVKAVFGPEGLSLSVDNTLTTPLNAPLLLWRGAFRLNDLPPGQSVVSPSEKNAPGDYTNAGALTSELAKLHGQIITAATHSPEFSASTTREAAEPMLIAWLEGSTVPPLIQPSAPVELQSQVLLRCPVRVQPSPVGSRVRIDGPFTSIRFGPERSLPYNPQVNRWVRTNQPGQWLFGFAAPMEIGRIRPIRATLSAEPTAPQHTITFVRGQCQNGSAVERPDGPVLARWQQPITPQSVSFEVNADDCDSTGTIWVLMQVQSDSSEADVGSAFWQFRRLEMGLESQVVGTPSARVTP